MKNQLAGLMKQAQAMQRNMEKVQEELGKTNRFTPVRAAQRKAEKHKGE